MLQEARERIEVIRLFIRLMKDMQQISVKQFVQINESVENVSKQLSGWQKAVSWKLISGQSSECYGKQKRAN